MSGYLLPHGKYEGVAITRVPIRYLIRLANRKNVDRTYRKMRRVAQEELERRGGVLPDIELTAHAIDRASLHLYDKWIGLRRRGEGLYTWLARISLAAFNDGSHVGGDEVHYKGMRFCFSLESTKKPVLKTVMTTGKKSHGRVPTEKVDDLL